MKGGPWPQWLGRQHGMQSSPGPAGVLLCKAPARTRAPGSRVATMADKVQQQYGPPTSSVSLPAGGCALTAQTPQSEAASQRMIDLCTVVRISTMEKKQLEVLYAEWRVPTPVLAKNWSWSNSCSRTRASPEAQLLSPPHLAFRCLLSLWAALLASSQMGLRLPASPTGRRLRPKQMRRHLG
jgi:hypothetical protein